MSATNFLSVLNQNTGHVPPIEVEFSLMGSRKVKVAGCKGYLHIFANAILSHDSSEKAKQLLQSLYIKSDEMYQASSLPFQVLVQLRDNEKPEIATIRDRVFGISHELQEALRECGAGVYLSSLHRQEKRAAETQESLPFKRRTPLPQDLPPIDRTTFDWRELKENLGIEVSLRVLQPAVPRPTEQQLMVQLIAHTRIFRQRNPSYRSLTTPVLSQNLRDAKELLGVETELRGILGAQVPTTQRHEGNEENDMFNPNPSGRVSTVSVEGGKTPRVGSLPHFQVLKPIDGRQSV